MVSTSKAPKLMEEYIACLRNRKHKPAREEYCAMALLSINVKLVAVVKLRTGEK